MLLFAVSRQHPATSRGQRPADCGLRIAGFDALMLWSFGAAISRQHPAASSRLLNSVHI